MRGGEGESAKEMEKKKTAERWKNRSLESADGGQKYTPWRKIWGDVESICECMCCVGVWACVREHVSQAGSTNSGSW